MTYSMGSLVHTREGSAKDSHYCSKSVTEYFLFKQALGMFLLNRHTCVASALLVSRDGNCGSDGPVPGCSRSWPFP